MSDICGGEMRAVISLGPIVCFEIGSWIVPIRQVLYLFLLLLCTRITIILIVNSLALNFYNK